MQRCADPDLNQLMLDIGCNLGYFSLLALKMGCDVICIEPNPLLIPVIARSAILSIQQLNDTDAVRRGSFVVVHAAAGTATAVVSLSIYRPHMGLSSVITKKGTEPQQTSEWIVLDVLVISVATMLRGAAGVVKIDVEGAELQAIAGLSKWMSEFGYDELFLELGDKEQAEVLKLAALGCHGVLEVSSWREGYTQELEDFTVDFPQRSSLQHPDPLHHDFWLCCRP